MRICIYGAASNRIDKKYTDAGFKLGKALGERGHNMVFGAGSEGMMGAVARGFKAAGAHVHGVIPRFFVEAGYEAIFYESDTITFTADMAERKQTMEDECEAFIITPGGIGTFEEFFQVLTLKQLGRHKKAIVIFNVDGYYNEMLALLNGSVEKGFVNEECAKLTATFTLEKDICDYLESYNPDDIDWSSLKRNEDIDD